MTVGAGDVIAASDVNNLLTDGDACVFLGDSVITTGSSTWTSTESGAVMTITVPTVVGRRYRIDFTGNIKTSTQTFAITSANAELAIMRIREDTASGTQLCGNQMFVTHASGNGFLCTMWALYTADATESKTFVVTGQRNGAASGGSQSIVGSATQPARMAVYQIAGA